MQDEKLSENKLKLKRKIDVNHQLTNIGINETAKQLKPGTKRNKNEVKKQSNHEEPAQISFFKLFKFATCADICFIFLGFVCSAASGSLSPVLFILFGDLVGILVEFHAFANSPGVNNTIELTRHEDALMKGVTDYLIYNAMLGVVIVILTYVSVLLISRPAIQQIAKIRSLYMASVLNKDIGWYDTHQTSDFSSRITEDLRKIEEAIGDKICSFIYYMTVFIAGLIAGLVYGWKLALICLIYCPASIITMALVSRVSGKLVRGEVEAYAKAASIAEEVLGAIRTIYAFDGQQSEIARYKASLKVAKSNNIKRGLFNAINNGCMWLFVFLSYALSFYYGVELILDEKDLPSDKKTYTPAVMITVFFNILVATWNFGQCAPFFAIFTSGRAAAAKIFALIEEPPTINLSKKKGMQMTSFQGNIKFNNVYFDYPSRPDVNILCGLNLDIKKGETIALVGNSGCGKSTVIQLLQRYYDPLNGQVTVDNIDIKDFDLKWLRSKIGVVGQEPVLFATTIEENIRFGNESASLEDIEQAARKANAHSFIRRLPMRYQTIVGERGAQLSGGQKQRIAIARALVRNPTILLLDEATSALDTHSESLVQEALDKASKECTTIIVAHRLSTIRGADRIVVIHEGKVIEDGKHEVLMEKKGAYYKLVTAQVSDTTDKDRNRLADEDFLHGSFLSPRDSTNIDPCLSIRTITDDIFPPEYGTWRILWEVLKMNRPEWWLIFIGSLGAIVQGSCIPLYAVVFGDVIGILSNDDTSQVRQDGHSFSLYFCIIGVACGIASFIQTYLLTISGEQLTLRVRIQMFESILNQEIGWFDKPENGVGALCTSLSNDASSIQGAAGQPIGTALTSLSSLGFAIILSFAINWRLTLVTLCFIPLVFVSIYLEAMFANGAAASSSIEEAAKYAIEAIGNIRTVASLGIENVFHVKYLELLGPHYKQSHRGAHMRGVVLGFARSLMFFCYSVTTYYGGVLIRDEHMEYSVLYKVTEALTSGAWAMGTAVAFTPNFQSGIVAAGKLIKLINRQPAIIDGKQTASSAMKSIDASYNSIKFAYPTRPEVTILAGLNLKISHGKTVALVGSSGCGKSTIIQMLERFYDPQAGTVSLGDKNVKSMKLPTLRSQLGIVSQEPNLFDRTIAQNIAYGDNTKEISMEEIIDAATKANIHSFILSLPLGYNTRLGEKGTQLSGGQKQRIAIARALIRDPPILLLDEATSALDTESEKIVQEALNKAKAGRTCITIAHRLVTIQDADVICVIDKGVVSEMGTHEELLEKRGIYHELYNMQMGKCKEY